MWPAVGLPAWPDGLATWPMALLRPGGLASASSETRLAPPLFAPHCVCALRVCAGPLQRRPNTPTSASQIRLRVEPARQVRPRRVEPARQIHPRRMEPAKIRHVHPRRVTPASASDVAPHRPHHHTHARERASECGPVCSSRERQARSGYRSSERARPWADGHFARAGRSGERADGHFARAGRSSDNARARLVLLRRGLGPVSERLAYMVHPRWVVPASASVVART